MGCGRHGISLTVALLLVVFAGGACLGSDDFEEGSPVAPLDPQGSLPERLTREIRSRETGVREAGGRGLRISDVVRAGSIFGDALAGHRPLGREDRTVLGTVAVFVLPLAVLAAIFPQVAGWSLAVVLGWLGGTAGARAALEARKARRRRTQESLPPGQEASDRG